ncbi:MAG: ATP-binding protein [Elusimicrobiota bacterium]|jgi:hypothetical protein|nr:ATP-binding protein [Elusimicrobiota bacterium]
MKNLPIGVQSFLDLRTNPNNYLYVDKTEYIYNLITSGKFYFLSRPRRFGKSLLISTMDELFSGNKKIFEGLFIYDKWNWEEANPVIRIDFGGGAYRSSELLNNTLLRNLNINAEKFGINLENTDPTNQFSELMRKTHQKTGRTVVLLIDEYDKPILDVIEDNELAQSNKKTLHDFYQVIKANDDHLKFVFLTGISKFAGLSVFSALNNLNDISLDKRYASICGYTQEELESIFAEHIERTAQELNYTRQELLDGIKKHYDGYAWNGKVSVYNPYSTLLFFDKQEFANYWFGTGTPTFLIEMIKKDGIDGIKDAYQTRPLSGTAFKSYDPSRFNDSRLPLLFQTGYLTIKSAVLNTDDPKYVLGMPNYEVRKSFSEEILSYFVEKPKDKIQGIADDICDGIKSCDEGLIERALLSLFAHIPYPLRIKKEAYYHSIFIVLMKLMNFDIDAEQMTNLGRIDAVLSLGQKAIITEVKHSIKKPAATLLKEAFKQIKDKKYYEKYLGKEIILLGIVFDGKNVKCKIKAIKS